MKDIKIFDEWRTPDDLFNALDKGGEYMGMYFEGYRFAADLCATKKNTKCKIFYRDYLNDVQVSTVYNAPRVATMQVYKEIGGTDWTCFMNPPYSTPKPFVEKAWEDSKYCKIVCLIKCDPSTKWWSTFWDYSKEVNCRLCRGKGYIQHSYENAPKITCKRCNSTGKVLYKGPKSGCEVLFFPKRIKFDPPQQLIERGEIFKFKDKWVQHCNEHEVVEKGVYKRYSGDTLVVCAGCKGKGYKELSGPTFPSCLLVFDRRYI